jgi:hypothetical protein
MAKLTSDLPLLDMSTSTTGCCPIFDPAPWDGQVFEFKDKPFIRDRTVSFVHIPLNMGRVMKRMNEAARDGDAAAEDFILLSEETSPWHADQYYAVSEDYATKEVVPEVEIVRLSGRYFAKVFEGEFKEAPAWHKDLIAAVEERGDELKRIFFYYTTCPNCAKVYGKNYVVGIAELG